MNIVLARPVARSYSGTFIETQTRRLPAAHTLDVPYGPGTRFDIRTIIELSREGLRGLRARAPAPHGRADAASQTLLAKRLRALAPDVVLVHYGPTAAGLVRACRAADVPLVAHFHGYDVWRTEARRRWLDRYREVFATAAGLVAVSSSMRQELIRLGAPPDKVWLIPCGADVDPARRADPATAPPRLVSVGRLVAKKGTAHALTALAAHRARGGQATLTIVGRGPLGPSLRRQAETLGLEDAVTFTGALPHPRVLDLLEHARALVHHSVVAPDGDREGTPVTVMEAGALGLPVLGSRHEGIADVVIDHETGRLADEGDVDALAAHIDEVCADPGLAASWGRAARRRVQQHFTADVTVARLRAQLKNVAKR